MIKRRLCLWCSAAAVAAGLVAGVPRTEGASHREAPITALDEPADITDVFAFVSFDEPDKVTFIMNVDPLNEPSNGPNYFPFDDDIVYAIRIDNNQDAVEDIVFEVRFETEIRNPELFTGFAGVGNGLKAPANSPAPVAPGTPIVPPAITSLDGPGSAGLSLRQTYTVTMVRDGKGKKTMRTDLTKGTLIAVPSNVGPRTMPDYPALARQGVFNLDRGVRAFAGTIEDPFYIDIGAAFDTFNFRPSAFPSGIPGVLTDAQDADGDTNFAPDDLSGFNVNTIALEVPITMLTRTGTLCGADDAKAVVGVWATTSRPRMEIRGAMPKGKRTRKLLNSMSGFRQVQRMANPLFNELLIGTGSKDKWSMSNPRNDSQFADFILDPLLARVLNAVYREALPIPAPPRNDLRILAQYLPPIAPAGTRPGPVADLLRLNTGVPPTPMARQSRLGVLGGDLAGFPNGRRPGDDVTDISLRVVAGVLAGPRFNKSPNNRLGDGVNANDQPLLNTFPFIGFAHSGRNSRHIDPGERFQDGRSVPVD